MYSALCAMVIQQYCVDGMGISELPLSNDFLGSVLFHSVGMSFRGVPPLKFHLHLK